jgi:hypothetical protein
MRSLRDEMKEELQKLQKAPVTRRSLVEENHKELKRLPALLQQ